MTTSETKKSICFLCLAECGIDITVQGDKFIKIVPDFSNPISKGYICEKAQRLKEYQDNHNRIKQPLKKVGEKFVPISWDQAFDEIVEKLKSLDRSKIFYMAPAYMNYSDLINYELVKLLGANYVTNVYSVEMMYNALVEGELLKFSPVPDIENSTTHIIIGKNTWVTQHYPRARKILNDIKNNSNRKLVVIDTCDTETSKKADIFFKIKPSTDPWLLSVLIKRLIELDKVDYEFLTNKTTNYSKIKDHFSKINTKEYLDICGIHEREFERFVSGLDISKITFETGNGLCHSSNPMTTIYLAYLLILITGNLNRTGSMQAKNFLLDVGMISHEYFTLEKTPYTDQKQINGLMPANIVADNLYIDDNNKFDCIIIDNCNPVERFPNSQKLTDALKKVNLVISLDSNFNKSCEYADYILPTPTFYERYELSISRQKAVLCQPINQAKYSKTDIYAKIVDKLNLGLDSTELEYYQLLFNTEPIKLYEILYDKFKNKIPHVYQILAVTSGAKFSHSILSIFWWRIFIIGKTYQDSETSAILADKLVSDLELNGYVALDDSIDFINEQVIDLFPIKISGCLKLNTSRLSKEGYSYILQCGYRNSNSVNNVIPNCEEPKLEISMIDAQRLSISDDDKILLTSESNKIVLPCKIVENQQQGLLRITNHAIINLVSTEKTLDYLNPRYKMVFANIEKI